MLDLILIQDPATGIGLYQYKGTEAIKNPDHDDLFNGFLSAFQGVMKELNLGKITQISTEDHHCIFQNNLCSDNLNINVILMFDCEDCVDFWKEKAHQIGCEFLKKYGNAKFYGNVSLYTNFSENLIEIIKIDPNSCID